MHIIVLENEASSLRGGQELSLLDVCRGLHNMGHSISLLYIKEGDLIKQYSEFCFELVKINSYRIERKRMMSSLIYFLADNIKIKTNKDSLVYSNQYHDSFWGYTLAISKNIPFVCHLRLPPPPIRTLGFQWNIGMRGAKRLIAVSNQTKLDWIKRGFKEDNIHVVYNGINTETFKPSEHKLNKNKWAISSEKTKIISYIGRIDKDKGIETLIKGFKAFLESDHHANLLIAGKPLCQNNEYQKSLEQLTVDLGIENYVKFMGHLTNPIPLYQISDITVLASLNSEPFGRTIIESMACGTPVVASRLGGIPEILTGEFKQGLFESGDSQHLADTLNCMFKWKNSDSQISEKCRNHILSNFHVNKMVEGIEKNLLDLVQY
ncbi:group 1 glycosyl transferase [Tolypothrix sp. NIES-4075]|uniref:glycosyltransferase family 4 protein n=1 Tax=Tolypothrix sp. NIES-4075 TaxID=2005459 RepID=UPI000B5C3BBF|nr:glycosyltransferase family 4 protein [Tolypothrix sp. NIES-4075]GAX40091.1 group 1 glycosyl transferase [Tolypothrix sp. NIES-4075]